MNNSFEYYYNNVPGKGLCRNNLIYTSLISKDKKTFCQWYHNDTDYHKGQNQVVDCELMDDKWNREISYLYQMSIEYPDLVPTILDIDLVDKKVFLKIDGPDFWQNSIDNNCTFDEVLPDWREQMLNIFKAHKDLGIYKYSLHPSSYFVVGGELRSINYFFCYHDSEPDMAICSVMSHISEERQADLFPKMQSMGIDINVPTPHSVIQQLAFESFKKDFPGDFMDSAKNVYR
jgi:hypothetical protein